MKTKQQLIQEIRDNLKSLGKANTFDGVFAIMDNSENTEFIIIATKSTVIPDKYNSLETF